jgi:peptidoglycan/LPS O-acetylase OafA/YrhL
VRGFAPPTHGKRAVAIGLIIGRGGRFVSFVSLPMLVTELGHARATVTGDPHGFVLAAQFHMGSKAATSTPSHKLPSLEGLRGIAAFVVVIWHLRLVFSFVPTEGFHQLIGFLPFLLQRILVALSLGVSNGTFAVWLFWIMSGFVLSLQYFVRRRISDSKARGYLIEATLRRYPRLLIPVLASVAIAYFLHAANLMGNIELARKLGGSYVSGWLGSWYAFPASAIGALKSAVWESFFAYEHATTYNSVLWTMEKEFYGSMFLFAFLGAIGHRKGRALAYVIVALGAFALRQQWLNAFVVGIALCDLYVNSPLPRHASSTQLWSPLDRLRRSRSFAALFWLVVVAGVGLPNLHEGHYLFFGTAAVIFTLVSIPTQHLLARSIPMFLGRISFGLYLVHFPIIFSFSCWLYLATEDRMGSIGAVVLSLILTSALSIVAGYVVYLVADRPGIRLSRVLAAKLLSLIPHRTSVDATAPLESLKISTVADPAAKD